MQDDMWTKGVSCVRRKTSGVPPLNSIILAKTGTIVCAPRHCEGRKSTSPANMSESARQENRGQIISPYSA